MLGLIKKDLLIIRSNLKILIILFLVYGVMALQGEMDVSFVLPFMSVVIMMSTFSYDTYNKWDAYVCSLPNGRKNSVSAKYLATIILLTITTIIITALAVIISYTHTKAVNFDDILMTVFGPVFATILLQSFMYPAIYKFGVEKARIGIFIVIFGVTIIASIIAKFINFKSFFQKLDALNNYWLIIVPIIMITVLYASYKISEKIYKNKEY